MTSISRSRGEGSRVLLRFESSPLRVEEKIGQIGNLEWLPWHRREEDLKLAGRLEPCRIFHCLLESRLEGIVVGSVPLLPPSTAAPQAECSHWTWRMPWSTTMRRVIACCRTGQGHAEFCSLREHSTSYMGIWQRQSCASQSPEQA